MVSPRIMWVYLRLDLIKGVRCLYAYSHCSTIMPRCLFSPCQHLTCDRVQKRILVDMIPSRICLHFPTARLMFQYYAVVSKTGAHQGRTLPLCIFIFFNYYSSMFIFALSALDLCLSPKTPPCFHDSSKDFPPLPNCQV